MASPTDKEIVNRAYEMWEQNGKPDGREDEFLRQAQIELSQGVNSDEKSETFLE